MTTPPVARTTNASTLTRSTDAAGNAEEILHGVRQSLSSGRPLRIRLDPPELGSLQIEIVRRDGGLVARLHVDNAAAHRTLLEHTPGLGEQLARQGHVLQSLDVEFAEHHRGDGRGNPSREEPRGELGGDGRRSTQEDSTERESPQDESSPRNEAVANTDIDVQV